jgi:hypothetical protein
MFGRLDSVDWAASPERGEHRLLQRTLAEDGVALLKGALTPESLEALVTELGPLCGERGRGGVRHLLTISGAARSVAAGLGRERPSKPTGRSSGTRT